MQAFGLDRIATQFAERRVSRRQAVTQGGAGLGAGVLAAQVLRTVRPFVV